MRYELRSCVLRSIVGLSCIVVIGCVGGGAPARTCPAGSPRTELRATWRIEHQAIDADPPRAKVSFQIEGEPPEPIGELEGTCHLVDVGALPDPPVDGAKVTELACEHGGRAHHAALVVAGRGAFDLRTWTRDPSGLAAMRTLRTHTPPPCARLVPEIVQGGDL